MTTQVTLHTEKIEKVSNDLVSAIRGKGRDKLIAFAERRLRADISAAFSGRKDPVSGKPWARRKEERPWPILQHTGKLRELIGVKHTVGEKGGTVKAYTNDAPTAYGQPYAKVGNVIMYGRYKNGGGRGGLMPPRRFAGMSKGSLRSIVKMAKRLIKEAAK